MMSPQASVLLQIFDRHPLFGFRVHVTAQDVGAQHRVARQELLHAYAYRRHPQQPHAPESHRSVRPDQGPQQRTDRAKDSGEDESDNRSVVDQQTAHERSRGGAAAVMACPPGCCAQRHESRARQATDGNGLEIGRAEQQSDYQCGCHEEGQTRTDLHHSGHHEEVCGCGCSNHVSPLQRTTPLLLRHWLVAGVLNHDTDVLRFGV